MINARRSARAKGAARTHAAPIDPKLGPLADNGGPTQTHALCTGVGAPHDSCTGASPAINAGSNALAKSPGPNGIPGDGDDLPLTTDQRGAPYSRILGAAVDMGAYELQSLSLLVTTSADELDATYDATDLSLREAIALIRRLWTEERVTFEGQYYRTLAATIYDRPEKPVPIWIAASGPTAAAMAGELADGFICTSGKGEALYRDTLLPKVEEGLKRASRPGSSIERMIEVKVSFDTDPQRALEDTRQWAALALTPEEKMSVEDPREMERLAEALPIERAASRWIVSSDPEEQLAQIRPYYELGFTHLVFHAPGPDQARFLRIYAEQVFPLLRSKLG